MLGGSAVVMIMDLVLSAVSAATPPTSTVYLMRHCSRSTYLPDLYGDQKPKFLANYSNGGDIPDWGVAPTLCTARGRRLIVGQGNSLRQEVTKAMGAHKHLKVTYDAAAKRDNTTALDFLTGLGLASLQRTGAPEIFDPPSAWCPRVSDDAKIAAVQSQLARIPQPPSYKARIAALQKTLGAGVAPPMQDLPDTPSGGAVPWLGGSFVASSWIEAMLLQLGAGLPVGYGRVSPEELFKLLELHVYYRAISDRGLAIERRGESNLIAHMLHDLSDASNGASLYVGHDTNLDGLGAMLDLAWPSVPPYPANTTVPGGLLRLSATGTGDDAEVSAAFLYTDLRDDSGQIAESAVTFGPEGKTSVTLGELNALATARSDARCVHLDHRRDVWTPVPAPRAAPALVEG